MNEKVVVGMSGGVDSSVTAILLMEQGFDVEGLTLKLFDDKDGDDDKRTCGSLKDIEVAKIVCQKLNIKHEVCTLIDEFKQYVITDFANSYKIGETPNPCIVCNKYIKFGKMLDVVYKNKNGKVATGHYVQKEYDTISKRYLLKKSTDITKDQTYMLYSLNQFQLENALFPLGGFVKSDVRKIAEKHGLLNAKKADSQDICFVPDGDYAKFLQEKMCVSCKKGDFIHKNGDNLGKHKGIIHYTIGQRKGLGISYKTPLFVIDKDVNTNIVTLGDNADLFSNKLVSKNVNYIPFDILTKPMKVTAKVRYSQNESNATLHPLNETQVMVEFEENQRAISKGQAVVFYDGDIVVGGGTIG